MKRFRNFPIWINYNIFTDKEREAALRDRLKRFYASKEGKAWVAELDEWRRKHGQEPYDYKPEAFAEEVKSGRAKRLDEIKWERQTKESIAYEDKVTRVLEKILKTPPGELLFKSMEPTVKVWILYHEGLDNAVAAATPGIMPAEKGGGVRLYFDPDGFDPEMEYYTPDDILFHELIHTYRSGKGKHNWQKMKEYKTADEFLAIHIQNVYMAFMGRTKYYFSHENPRLVTKDEIYKTIRSDDETRAAFKHFLKEEPYAQGIAKLTTPDFNCWRDLANI